MNPEAGACWVAVEVGHCNAARVVRIVGGMYYDDCNKSLLSCFSNGTTTVLIQGNNNRLCVTDTTVCSGNDSLTVVIIGNNNRVCEGSGTICSFNAAVTFVSIGTNNRYCNNHVHDGTRVVV